MILTIFLAIVFCVAITLMMFAAVAFIQDKKFFSSAPKEAQEALLPRDKELFYGARTIGWTLMVLKINPVITKQDVIGITGRAESTAKRYLNLLIDINILVKEGDSVATIYRRI